MSEELKRLLTEKLLIDDLETERRVNRIDRRRLKTYIFRDQRSGLADRRADTFELIKRFQFGYKGQRRLANSDRRRLNTFIIKDRRSGVADRRSGS
jgi:abortive infection bacteriophage resistance protein